MRFLVVFLFLVAYTQATSEPISYQRRIKEAQQQCIQENNYDATEIERLSKDDVLPENDKKFNDYVFCYWNNIDVVNEDGEFNTLQMKVILPFLIMDKFAYSENKANELSDKAVDECIEKVHGNSKGQASVQLRNCITKYFKDEKN